MEIEDLRDFCLSQPGTTEDMKWGENLTFMVGEKMYAIFGLERTPIRASFKVSNEDFEKYLQRPGMRPAPYLARAKWIAIGDISQIAQEEWKKILSEAYEIIRDKLPKRVRENL